MATCSYNGISFTSLYKSKVSSKPIMDEAGRTTVCVEHVIELEGYVLPNVVTGTTDTPMSSIRKLLTAQGGALYFSDKGFADLNVNTEAAGVRDVAWGPHPELLEWLPLGGDGGGACKVTWRVTTRIPECSTPTYAGAPMALNYEQDFGIDYAGYTTVTTSGYLEIPMTRRTVSDRSLPDSVDLYRERLQNSVVPGYARKDQSFNVSKDKRRLDFSWTDEEIPTAYPERVASIEARQTVSPSDKASACRWSIVIEATIEMVQGAAKSEALRVFLRLLGSRVEPMRRDSTGKLLTIPFGLRAEEDIFGRTSRFSITVVFLATEPNVGHFLAVQSQLWRAVPTDHSLWLTSLAPFKTHGVRGYNGAFVSPASDGLVDLCLKQESSAPIRNGVVAKQGASSTDDERAVNGTLKVLLKNLTPVNSWLDYRVWLRYNEKSGAVRHKLLLGADDGAARQPAQPDARPGAQYVWGGRLGSDESIREQIGPGVAVAEGPGTRTADPVQRPVGPSRRIWLEGYARRLGYRIPVPRLLSVGGVQPIEKERWIDERPISAIAGIPIYQTVWSIEYIVPASPSGTIEIPANPILGIDGTAGASGKLTP